MGFNCVLLKPWLLSLNEETVLECITASYYHMTLSSSTGASGTTEIVFGSSFFGGCINFLRPLNFLRHLLIPPFLSQLSAFLFVDSPFSSLASLSDSRSAQPLRSTTYRLPSSSTPQNSTALHGGFSGDVISHYPTPARLIMSCVLTQLAGDFASSHISTKA